MLNERNMRMTRQRKVILEELINCERHPSADELYEQVRLRLPKISLGTVYRNLEILCDLGKIQKLEHCGTQKRFDGNPNNHYHIRCMRCDRIEDAPINVLKDIEKTLSQETDYHVIGHRLEFIGLCEGCSRQLAVLEKKTSLLL